MPREENNQRHPKHNGSRPGSETNVLPAVFLTSARRQKGLFTRCSIRSLAGLSLCAATAFADVAGQAPANMLGFTAANAARQQTLERKFDAQLDPADQRAWLERMSAEPNHVGSPHNQANAEFVL